MSTEGTNCSALAAGQILAALAVGSWLSSYSTSTPALAGLAFHKPHFKNLFLLIVGISLSDNPEPYGMYFKSVHLPCDYYKGKDSLSGTRKATGGDAVNLPILSHPDAFSSTKI